MKAKFKRKLIQYGGSLSISIPAAWLRYYGLSKGDEVEIVTNGRLIVQPVKDTDADKVVGNG